MNETTGRSKQLFFLNKRGRVEFTSREIDIISCLIVGRKTKGIAEDIAISPKTVDNSILNLRAKLSINSREQIKTVIEFANYKDFFIKHYHITYIADHLFFFSSSPDILINKISGVF